MRITCWWNYLSRKEKGYNGPIKWTKKLKRWWHFKTLYICSVHKKFTHLATLVIWLLQTYTLTLSYLHLPCVTAQLASLKAHKSTSLLWTYTIYNHRKPERVVCKSQKYLYPISAQSQILPQISVLRQCPSFLVGRTNDCHTPQDLAVKYYATANMIQLLDLQLCPQP